MESCVGVTLTKSDPLSGGAFVAVPVTLSADHTGAAILLEGELVIGDAKSSTSPLLVSAAMSTPDAPEDIESVPATFGASVNVVTSSTDQEFSVAPLLV